MRFRLATAALALSVAGCVSAGPAAAAARPPARTSAPAVRPDKTEQAALENEFRRMLSGATLEGVFQMTGRGGLDAAEPLSEPKTERYMIASVSKSSGDHWVVNARIQYASYDVTVPLLVRVVWAERTPVITLDDLAVPSIGTYSARVMFHRGFYSGVWYSNAKNYGGTLSGRIVKSVASKKPKGPATGGEKTDRDKSIGQGDR